MMLTPSDACPSLSSTCPTTVPSTERPSTEPQIFERSTTFTYFFFTSRPHTHFCSVFPLLPLLSLSLTMIEGLLCSSCSINHRQGLWTLSTSFVLLFFSFVCFNFILFRYSSLASSRWYLRLSLFGMSLYICNFFLYLLLGRIACGCFRRGSAFFLFWNALFSLTYVFPSNCSYFILSPIFFLSPSGLCFFW